MLLLAGGKEVEEQLKHREGSVGRDEEVEVDDAGVGGSGGADEAADKLEKVALE